MVNLHLWLKAIREKLDTVHVSSQADIATMHAVFNTLEQLEEDAKNEADNQPGD